MVESNWKVGDRAMIWAPDAVGKHKHLHGTLCTIISLEAQYPERLTVESDECPYPLLDVTEHKWKGWAVKLENLQPIDKHTDFDESMKNLF